MNKFFLSIVSVGKWKKKKENINKKISLWFVTFEATTGSWSGFCRAILKRLKVKFQSNKQNYLDFNCALKLSAFLALLQRTSKWQFLQVLRQFTAIPVTRSILALSYRTLITHQSDSDQASAHGCCFVSFNLNLNQCGSLQSLFQLLVIKKKQFLIELKDFYLLLFLFFFFRSTKNLWLLCIGFIMFTTISPT